MGRRYASVSTRRHASGPAAAAAVVGLLDATPLRVGNTEYRTANDTFGLTTLADDHAGVRGDRMTFTFRVKGGKVRTVDIRDARLARVVRPGEVAGEDYSRRAFRTRGASVIETYLDGRFACLWDAGVERPVPGLRDDERGLLGVLVA